MLRISNLADYGTVVMHHLAEHLGEQLSAGDIATAVGINTPTVSKILKHLLAAELLVSQRGASGGYQLAKAPEAISLADVVAAIEGLPAMTQCCSTHHACSLESVCAIKGNWQVINQIVHNALASFSLADIQQPIVAGK